MRHPLPRLGAALAFALAVPTLAMAQATTLAPQQERISDSVIQQDNGAFERLQERIKLLNDGGRRVADYHLSKAQCWLDVSFHEYTRNDRSPFPQAALTESEKLIVAMETGGAPLPSDTPLVNGAARLRPDLWERTRLLELSPGFVCAAQKTACAEVELVHAGNEYNQQQWRHAKPYVQIAEDQIAEAEMQAQQCLPKPPPPVIATPVPPAPSPVRFTLKADVVFGFDRSDAAGMLPASREEVVRLLRTVETGRLRIDSIRLIGHADRLNGTGNAAYNQALSLKRAESVRALLVSNGVDAKAIEVEAVGDSGPVAACNAQPLSTVSLEDCLAPNRRVEIVVNAVKLP